MVPRENKSNTYAKFWTTNKEYYGIFESGLCSHGGASIDASKKSSCLLNLVAKCHVKRNLPIYKTSE